IGAGCQQTIDHPAKRLRRRIIQKRLDLRRSRRQAGQIKRRPANQRALVRRRCGREMLLVKLREDESVDWRLRPLLVSHLWNDRLAWRLKRPPAPGVIMTD